MCSKTRAVTFLCLLLFLDLSCNLCRADQCSVEDGLRLAGFNSNLAGYVEICKNQTWLRLLTDRAADQSWTHKNSIVVCRQLGYLDALWMFDKTSYSNGVVQPERSSNVFTASVGCKGNEQTLSNCLTTPIAQHSLENQQINFVACRQAPFSGDIRLLGVSSSDHEGLVEMYFSHRGYRWSTLCTNGWDDVEAAVVCKQLGYHTGKSKYYSSLEVNIDQLPRQRYDRFRCNGTESSLSQCSNDGPYPYKCYSRSYGGVICQNYDNPSMLHVPPTAAFLVLVTGLLLLAIVMLALIAKCVTNLKKKVPSIATERHLDHSLGMHHNNRVSRVRLDPLCWNQISAVARYSSLSDLAPPSYNDTIQADQEAQEHIVGEQH